MGAEVMCAYPGQAPKHVTVPNGSYVHASKDPNIEEDKVLN